MIDQELHQTIDIEIIPTIETEAFRRIEINDIIIDHVIIQTTDQTITDQIITTTKINHAIIHRIDIQVITIEKEPTLSHHIVITHVIKIHNKIVGVVHLNKKCCK